MSDSYRQLLIELAELTGRVRAQRAEAEQWYERQCAAAERAVRSAEKALAAAENALQDAWQEVEQTEAEAAHLWQALGNRLGVSRRLGEPPIPAPGAPADPATLLAGVRDLLERTRHPGELSSSMHPLLAVFGIVAAAAAYGVSLLARWAGTRYGGDLAVGLPVLGLLVALIGPVAGLVPAKLLADRQHASLDVRAVAVVLFSGVLTTGLLFALLR